MSKILIVDDHEDIVNLIKYNLDKEGFETCTATDGIEALELIKKENPDLMVLDIMMPNLDGLEVVKKLRQTNNLPILMLTARTDEIDKILALEMGADDYLTKPFSPREMVARVKAILRRSKKTDNKDTSVQDDHIIVFKDITIDQKRHQVKFLGEILPLTPKEYKLLLLLLKNPGQVFSRDELLARVWGYDYLGDTRTVDVHISHLRDKLESDPKNPNYIQTIRSVGYKLKE